MTPAKNTVPAAAAWMGVPMPTPMSMPLCITPQRAPNGDVTGPTSGHARRTPPVGFLVVGGVEVVVGLVVEVGATVVGPPGRVVDEGDGRVVVGAVVVGAGVVGGSGTSSASGCAATSW